MDEDERRYLLFYTAVDVRLVMNVVPSDDVVVAGRSRLANSKNLSKLKSPLQQVENVSTFAVLRQIGVTRRPVIRRAGIRMTLLRTKIYLNVFRFASLTS